MQKTPCSELFIPSRLWRNNKLIIDDFSDGEEVLFRWFDPNKVQFESNGQLSAATLKQAFTPLLELSCNRSSLCLKATDVLYGITKLPHRDGFGVISTKIGNIHEHSFDFDEESKAEGRKKLILTFKLRHDPEDCMFPHTVIRIYKDGVEQKSEIKRSLEKTAIRNQLGKLFTVCHHPNSEFKLELEYPPMELLNNEKDTSVIVKYVRLWFKKLISFFQ